MRAAVLALALVASGCGSLVPYSLAPGWLAPDVVPDRTASAVVVTDTAPGASVLQGRVVDGRTGEPLAGAAVALGAAEATADADGRFALAAPGGDAGVVVSAPGYAAASGRVTVEGRTSVLVLLDREARDE